MHPSVLARRQSQQLGFTLIELLVVIVILGILMAVAVPTFLRQQVKAQDSRTQQYLTTAFEAIRASTPDTNNQYPSSTSMVSWIQQSEPELTAERGDCLTGVTSAPVDAVLVDPGSTSNSLQLCARSQSGNIWKLTASATGVQQLLDGTLVPLTVSGNEITDAVREAAASWPTNKQGGSTDGATPPGGMGVWEAGTNLFRRGQADATTDWTQSGTGVVTIATDATTPAPFSPQSIKATTDGNASGQGIYANTAAGQSAAADTIGAGSIYFKGVTGASYNVSILWRNTDSSTTVGTALPVTATGNWQLITPTSLAVAAGKTGDKLQIGVVIKGTRAESFWVAHAMLQKGVKVVSPYIATSGGATATRNAARVQAPAPLLNATQGWVAMRVRMGWPSSSPPGGYPRIFQWGTSPSDQVYAWFGANSLFPHRISGGTNVGGSVTTSFAAGDTETYVIAWDSSHLYASVNGTAFSSWASTPPTITDTAFDIGSQGTTYEIDSSVLWFATGTGTLSDADAATINSWGNADPKRSSFPTSAQATMVWDGVGATGSLK